MRAGLLTEVISVEKPVVDRNTYGANTINWEAFIESTKARVTYSNGNRTNENNEIVFAYEVIFTVRIYHQIKEDMRIIWNGKKYRILSIEVMKEEQAQRIKTELINE